MAYQPRAGEVFDDVAAELPAWLRPIAEVIPTVHTTELSLFAPPPEGGRDSAILLLFGETDGEPDLLFIERASHMRSHAGQPAFPGGAVDDTDTSIIETALREAHEETGLDAGGVRVFGTLPDLWLSVSKFVVAPVLGWWAESSHVYAAQPDEVASVHRIGIAELLDPANRVKVRHPSGYIGDGFTVRGLLIWGFTAGLFSRLMNVVGWTIPWDTTIVVDVDVEGAPLTP